MCCKVIKHQLNMINEQSIEKYSKLAHNYETEDILHQHDPINPISNIPYAQIHNPLYPIYTHHTQ